MNTPAIEFTAVCRSFGPVRALRDLSFSASPGSVTVLLGPNGAGKTTTVRLTTGALGPDSGQVRVLGRDPAREGEEVRRRCGVIPPKPAFYEQLTGRENLLFAAKLFGAPAAAAGEAARQFGIADALEQDVAGYSTGMRARLALARAVLHDPEVLLLDEPTAGLDPESSRAVLQMIRRLSGRGRTVLMCTHLLHEAEGIADRVILMHTGTLRASGHPRELAGHYLSGTVVLFDAEDRTALHQLKGKEGVLELRGDDALHVVLDRADRLPDLVRELVASGARLTRVEPQVPTLEELYFEAQRVHGKEE